MHQLAPSVLIIGYGKIGKIKAEIWKQCGANVFVSDITKKRIESVRMDGFSVDEALFHKAYNFVDICTPSSTHIEVLRRIIVNNVRFDRVVIEKPLFNNIQEKRTLYELLDNDASLREKIIVNEQYYRSKVIKLLQEKLLKDKVKHIKITMSKNRKRDNQNGRFVDNDIGAYGIELPHILAILEMLDKPIDSSVMVNNVLYVDSDDENNQGILIEYVTKNDTTVVINSFLGDFKISTENKISDNKIIDRSLLIEGDGFAHRVILDPHPSHERLLTELNWGDESTLIRDDMLTENISDIISDNIVDGCKLEHAIKHSEQAMSLFNNANIVEIKKEDNYVHNS
ncbi:Gfo/Idh/MocA family oxidoreductase (plasmid) [Bacillus mycoides]|nr:Gfo/Idh/MocA family oxidoreductase [Bacillus mycoides]